MEESMIHKFRFEGGPLDGCVLEVPGGRFLCDIYIGVPAKMDGDEQDSMSGELIYQYQNCHTWAIDGTDIIENYMGQVSARKVSLSVINKVFSAGRVLTHEKQMWINDLNKAIERVEEKESIGFDANNDDESDEEREEDGEGWKNK